MQELKKRGLVVLFLTGLGCPKTKTAPSGPSKTKSSTSAHHGLSQLYIVVSLQTRSFWAFLRFSAIGLCTLHHFQFFGTPTAT